MNEVAKHFIGTHDFTGFCSQKTEVESKVRTLYQSEIIQTDEGFDYVVTGSGFLYNMVRVLVAFLIEVGKGKRHASEVSTLLNEKIEIVYHLQTCRRSLFREDIFNRKRLNNRLWRQY